MDKLQKYKRSSINKLINNYNKNINALKNKLTVNIKNVHSLKIASSKKAGYIINYISNYNRVVNKLKIKLHYTIKQLQLLVALPEIFQPQINHPTKSALLIGINYINTINELQGCINDTTIVANLLKKYYSYNNIQILTDHTNTKPTKNKILIEFAKLMTNATAGDTIVFFYSGHGTTSVDLNGDEPTGNSQCIVPIDAQNISSCIIDDELNASIKLNLKSGVTLYAIFDSCFSGSILDLKYQYLDTLNSGNNTINNIVTDTPGQVYLFSGCNDVQTSADATFQDGKKTALNGAMTYALVQTITSVYPQNPSFTMMLDSMRSYLSNGGFTQIPQLSSGQVIDASSCIFTL
jgi:hypothetical protein